MLKKIAKNLLGGALAFAGISHLTFARKSLPGSSAGLGASRQRRHGRLFGHRRDRRRLISNHLISNRLDSRKPIDSGVCRSLSSSQHEERQERDSGDVDICPTSRPFSPSARKEKTQK
jgi:hypothetical protein